MDPLVLGIVVLVVFSSLVSLLLVQALQRGRAEGLQGAALLLRLLPFLVADALMVGVFVVWLLLR